MQQHYHSIEPFGQTKVEATIVIISLLLVAVIIGYVTAWLYCKSVCTKSIKSLKLERDELRKTINSLNDDKNSLQKYLREKDNEIEQLKQKG